MVTLVHSAGPELTCPSNPPSGLALATGAAVASSHVPLRIIPKTSLDGATKTRAVGGKWNPRSRKKPVGSGVLYNIFLPELQQLCHYSVVARLSALSLHDVIPLEL